MGNTASIAWGFTSSTASSGPRPRPAANSLKCEATIEGTRHALVAGMYDADEIEAINFEQLATPTDRLLLRGSRMSKRRPSTPSVALAHSSQPRIVAGPALYDLDIELPTLAARGSQPRIVTTAAVQTRDVPSLAQPAARGSQPHIAAPAALATAATPAPSAPAPVAARSRAFAITVVVPALVGIAAGLVAML